MRFPLAILLVPICLGFHCVAEAREAACRPEALDASAREALLSDVATFAAQPADTSTLTACRRRGEYFTSVDTVHSRLGDGTQQWRAVSCSRKIRSRQPWQCAATRFRAFEAKPFEHLPTVDVAIPEAMAIEQARFVASRAFASIEGAGTLEACPTSRGSAKSFAE